MTIHFNNNKELRGFTFRTVIQAKVFRPHYFLNFFLFDEKKDEMSTNEHKIRIKGSLNSLLVFLMS